jgi:phosphonate transport system permease protein
MSGDSAGAAHYSLALPAPAVQVRRWALAVAIVLVVVAAFRICLSSDHIVNWGGWTLTRRFLQGAFAPQHDLEILKLTAASALTTIAFSLCGSAVSVCLGTIGGILASEVWCELWGAGGRGGRWRWVWFAKVVRALLAIPRGIHEVVWGLFLINVLGLDPLVAVLAIGIPFGAITAKVFAETIDGVPKDPALRFRSAGASTVVAFAYGILPRAFPLLLSYALYRLECAIRSAAVLGLIGAGGLGHQIMLSLQSLRYEEVWTFLYALMLLVALTDWSSSRLTKALRSRSASTSTELTQQTRSVALMVLAVTAALVSSYLYLSLDAGRMFEPARLELLAEVLASAMPPRFAVSELSELVTLSAETLAMSIAAVAIAAPAAIVVSWFSSMSLFRIARGVEPSSGRNNGLFLVALTTLIRTLLIGTRALSDGIWVLLALSVFFPGTFAGACALAAYNFGVMGRLLAQINESADKRPLRALIAQGASFGRALLYGLIPLALPKYLAYILYRWEVCVRATVVVGIVGAGGLGRRLEEQLAGFDYSGVAATLAVFVLLTIVADAASDSGRRALRAA